jgi:hypothetical protein
MNISSFTVDNAVFFGQVRTRRFAHFHNHTVYTRKSANEYRYSHTTFCTHGHLASPRPAHKYMHVLIGRVRSTLFQLPAAHSLSAGASSLGERLDFAVDVFNDTVHNTCIALCIWSGMIAIMSHF